MKNCDILLIFAQNIDCGYMLEPPSTNDLLWIRKFSRDFYFAIFTFSNDSRVLKFASKHSCSWPFSWVEDRRSLFFFMRETN